MKPKKFIDLDDRSEYHLDINELYQKGIELVQKYSGDNWTDYNEHDPGVTILENLAFGITDVCFRLGFNMFDYLSNDKGELDADKQALYKAEEILTTHPVTKDDFRKIIFDKLEIVSNVWIEPNPSSLRGLYDIVLYAKPEIHFLSGKTEYWEELKLKIQDDLRDIWPSLRNIGEDLSSDGVLVLSNQNVYVRCSLVVDGAEPLESILASIVFHIDNYFNPELSTKSIEHLINKGIPIEEIFEGPLLKNGFVDEESISVKRPISISKTKVVAAMTEVKGVLKVEDLELLEDIKSGDSSKDEIVIIKGHIPRFCFELGEPDSVKSQQLLVKKDGNGYLLVKMRMKNNAQYFEVDFDRMIKILREKQAKRSRAHAIDLDARRAKHLKRETNEPFDSYSTIQNEFPYIYAINEFGLSKYDSKERKSEVYQLKAYLILFEQLLINFTSQVQNLKELYSPSSLDKTYFPKPLTHSQIRDIEKLYRLDETLESEEQLGFALDRVLNKLNEYNPHLDRKSRLLDYMLAIYGETFNQSSLRRMPGEWGGTSTEEFRIVENKSMMLKHLQHFNKNASKAPIDGASVEDQSGFQTKVAVLLGIDPDKLNDTEAVSDKIRNGKLSLSVISDEKLKRDPYLSWEQSVIFDLDHYQVESYFDLSDFNAPSHELLEEYSLNYLGIFSQHYLPVSLIRSGAKMSNYRILKGNRYAHLLIRVGTDENKWYLVEKFEKLKEAILSGHKLFQTLMGYNHLGENFKIIDHILLRPGDNVPEDDSLGVDFYEFNCSIIFPSWSYKLSDPYFQRLAHETILFNVPSHVVSNIYWLDFDEYERFHWLHERWKESRDDVSTDMLKRFLMERSMNTDQQ